MPNEYVSNIVLIPVEVLTEETSSDSNQVCRVYFRRGTVGKCMNATLLSPVMIQQQPVEEKDYTEYKNVENKTKKRMRSPFSHDVMAKSKIIMNKNMWKSMVSDDLQGCDIKKINQLPFRENEALPKIKNSEIFNFSIKKKNKN